MGEASRIVVGGLNVVLSPHPVGAYLQLLQQAANREIYIGGSDHAKITAPEAWSDENIVHGRICVWTDIEKDGDWFNKKKNDKASDEDKKKVIIPDDIAPNYRYFYYGFDLQKHLLIYEQKNEARQGFGPARALKFFTELFYGASGNVDSPEVNITAIPEANALDHILALPRLSFLKIVVTKPNPDDMTDDFRRIMQKLMNENASTLTQELQKAPKVQRLTPDADTRKLAQIGALNGWVQGKERGGQSDSTKSHPRSVIVEVESHDSILARFLGAIRSFFTVEEPDTGDQ